MKKKRIIVIHNPRYLPLVFVKFFRSKIEFYSMLHNDIRNFKYYQLLFYYLTKNLVKNTICVSASVLRSMTAFVSNPFVIDNSVPISEISGYKSENRSNDLIIIGRFVSQKNVFLMKQVIDSLPENISIVWIGAGRLRKKILNENRNSRINFIETMPRSEVYKLLGKSKCYLCLSRWEGVGVSNLEAIAAGCSVVLSDIPPHKEIAEVAEVKLVKLSANIEDIGTTLHESIEKFKPIRLSHLFVEKYSNTVMLNKYNELFKN